ncbi:MAG: hypothetical protein KJN71_04760 [Acidimicrobiia bacterium]|nr:hypothetical protein [Acidimicrobiia bacterium]
MRTTLLGRWFPDLVTSLESGRPVPTVAARWQSRAVRRFLAFILLATAACGGGAAVETPSTTAAVATSTTTTASTSTTTIASTSTSEASTTSTLPNLEACPPVELRPLTLPWATSVSDPDHEDITPEGASVVGWEGPPYSQNRDGPNLSVVEIHRGVRMYDDTLSLMASGLTEQDLALVTGPVRGNPAVLLGLDGTDVEATWLYWKEGPDRCDEYGLRVSPHSSTIWNLLPQIGPEDGWGVWPEWTPRQSALASRLIEENMWRRDLVTTVERFAAEVLGWESALVDVQSEAWASASMVVMRQPGDRGVYVSARRAVANELWLVDVVWTRLPEDDGCALSVGVWEDQAVIGFLDRGATLVDVAVGYGNETVTASVDPEVFDVVELDLTFPREEPGFVSVLLRDANGDVFDAVITGLPSGDFAAC